MKNYLNKIMELIKNSIYNSSGKESSTRIMSYIIGAIVLLYCLVFIGIEISAAIIALGSIGKYELSSSILIIFSSLLVQQLTLLGINKNAETKIIKSNIENGKIDTVAPITQNMPANDLNTVSTDNIMSSNGGQVV
jgi:hypothetical protein